MPSQTILSSRVEDDITQAPHKAGDSSLSTTCSSSVQEIAAEESSPAKGFETSKSDPSYTLKSVISSFISKLRCFGKKQKSLSPSKMSARDVENSTMTSELLPECSFNSSIVEERKITLVLDLDETLIHTSCSKPPTEYDFAVQVQRIGAPGEYTAYVKKRPFVDDFLREVTKHFEVFIFTASRSNYAGPVISRLEADAGITFSNRFFRESCTYLDGVYYKDLRKLGRPLRNLVLVDNSPQAGGLQPGNYIPVTSWYEDTQDGELKLLGDNLSLCYEYSDVRECIKSLLNPWRFVEFEGLHKRYLESQSRMQAVASRFEFGSSEAFILHM